ncbi:glycosyltransferase [Sulfuracidifex metallicus]|uniref:Glycosyltransferase n=2 Tax=Sulfuracidifex metallicus TaxID=47303 RepID=A0A6A9QH01_SULME|nr:glycosyltransferase [Sulfuracidifex metallicus]MUN28497.1 glycosyltransferase [Sulfuracidifex metallicus DSM 6482 = JCM 9184]WOE50971.1 glycosyltransferase [Sulfuracidifex metallicus DSM 6482 = JCM 9184]
MNICIYGTVYNSVNTVENTIESVFDPEISSIVIVDSYSTDGTYEKLKEIEKEFNLTILRFKSSRGIGRGIALKHCPDNSVTAYIDLDVTYTPAFRKIVKSGIKNALILHEANTFIGVKEEILSRGNWKDLNSGEDREFFSRMKIQYGLPIIIGKNFVYNGAREKRYARKWREFIKRELRWKIDTIRGTGYSFVELMRKRQQTLVEELAKPLAYLVAKVEGIYRNSKELNNWNFTLRNFFYNIDDPQKYGIDNEFIYPLIVERRSNIIDYNKVREILLNNFLKLIEYDCGNYSVFTKQLNPSLKCNYRLLKC